MENSSFIESLRRDAASHGEKQIGMQSIVFSQGREIARTYVDMMISYARLDVRSGQYEQQGDRLCVSGFCRIEEKHFSGRILKRTRRQSFWTAQWTETVALAPDSDLFDAFQTSFAEFCRAEQISAEPLTALIREKSGKLAMRPLPVSVTSPEILEGIGFPYTILF